MCRHLGHLGPTPIALASLVSDPVHSLLVQSYAPTDMRGGGTVNADGFGVGYWAPGAYPSPAVYRQAVPMWTDGSFLDVAPTITARSVVAAVRSATVGMPVSTAACAPFTADGLLFSHNGVVRGWPESMADLAETLPAIELLTLEAATDSALLWALVRARLRAGEDPVDAVAAVVTDTLAAAPGSRLNLLLGDGDRLVATAVDHALSVREHPDGAVTVASEPLDDHPDWRPVPDGALVVVDPARAAPVTVTSLIGRRALSFPTP